MKKIFILAFLICSTLLARIPNSFSLKTLTLHRYNADKVISYSLDQEYYAVLESGDPHTYHLKLWNLRFPEKLAALIPIDKKYGSPKSLHIAPNGNSILAEFFGNDDATLLAISLERGTVDCFPLLYLEWLKASTFALSPSGERVAYLTYGEDWVHMNVFDIKNNRYLKKNLEVGMATAFAFQNERFLWAKLPRANPGEIKIVDVEGNLNSALFTYIDIRDTEPSSPSLMRSGDGKTFIGHSTASNSSFTIDATSHEINFIFPWDNSQITAAPLHTPYVLISDNKNRLYLIHGDKKINYNLFDNNDFKPLATSVSIDSSFIAISYLRDGLVLVLKVPTQEQVLFEYVDSQDPIVKITNTPSRPEDNIIFFMRSALGNLYQVNR